MKKQISTIIATVNFPSLIRTAKRLAAASALAFLVTTFTPTPTASAIGITVPIHTQNNTSEIPIVNRISISTIDALYPETFMVTKVTPTSENGIQEWILELTCANGNVFTYISEDGDWFQGDMASAIMADSGTMKVTDDRILKLTYAGYEGCDAWAYVSERKYN